jgi:formylglycine-generating enzyme required for sulfatase activity
MLLPNPFRLFILLGAISLQLQAAPAVSNPIHNLKFVTIPAGHFVMGTADLDEALSDQPEPKAAMIKDETPAHAVVFEKAFLLSQTEITQKTWLSIMGTKPGPAPQWRAKNWQQLPVVSVSWERVAEFIDTINQQSGDMHYRLPTEAEWEYAARAGDSGLRPFPVLAMDEFAWYIHNSNDEIQPVATLEANAWNLYDMYGNAWEWVSDWYSPAAYAQSTKINPQGPAQGTKKVRRGGSFHCQPHMIRSAYRAANFPSDAYSVIGFRLVAEKK